MTYNLKIFLLIAFTFIFLMPLNAHAQNISIAVVDIEKILSDSLAGKSIQLQLKSRREAFQKEFSAREDNLMTAQESLINQKNDISAEDFAKKRQDFEKQLTETRNLFQKRRNSLEQGLSNALGTLRKNIIQVTAEVANEDKYQMVLTRDSVVIVEKEMDITEAVLSRLNAKISNISIDVN